MTDRPILFSGPMVRALLDGRKTQTRRVVKNPEWTGCLTGDCPHGRQSECDAALAGMSPYGVAGDRLWVRETCRAEENADGFDGVRYLADDQWAPIENTAEAGERWSALFHYGQKSIGGAVKRPGGASGKGVPSIHMPRWASRITLEITGVRVERLNDCSDADALAEGLPWGDDHHPIAEVHGEAEGRAYCPKCSGWGVHGALGANLGVTEVDCAECDTPQKMYRNLWEHINGAGSWAANPWVWAVSFEVIR